MLGVLLGRVRVMIGRVQRVAVRDLGMMRGLLVIAGLVMLGGFAMMLGGMLVVMRGVLVMFVNLMIAHRFRSLTGWKGAGASARSVNYLRRAFVRWANEHEGHFATALPLP